MYHFDTISILLIARVKGKGENRVMENKIKLHLQYLKDGRLGTSVFETMRAYNGNIFCINEHLQRLEASAKAVGFKGMKTKKVEQILRKKLAQSRLQDASLRIGYDEKKIFVIIKPLDTFPQMYYEEGVKIITVPTVRNLPSAIDGKIKSGDFLWGVMAKIESVGALEAVLLNKDGYVTEGTVSNIFIVRRFFLVTPPSYLGVLEGITRKVVMEIAEKIGIHVQEKPFTRYNLYNADECFLTNTSMEIMPVVNVDGRILREEKPGVVTSRLLKEFRKLTTERAPST